MILSIKSPQYATFKILDFQTQEKIIGVYQINSSKMSIKIYNHTSEKMETKKLKLFGIDEAQKILWIELK